MKTLTIETAIINACIELYGDASHATLNTIKRACREKGMGYDKLVGKNGADLANIKWIGARAVPAILKGIKMWKESKKGANTEVTVQIKGDELIDNDTAICQMEKETLRQENLEAVKSFMTEDMSQSDLTILLMEADVATDKGMTHNEYMHSVFLGEKEQQDEEDRLVEELKNATGTDAETTEEAYERQAERNKLDRDVEEYNDNNPGLEEVTEEVTTQEYLIMITKGSTTKYYQDIARNTITGPRLLTSLLARHAKTSSNLEAIKARAVTLRDKLSAMGMGVHIRKCTVRSGRVIAHS